MGKQVWYGRVGAPGMVLWISGSWVLQWASLMGWANGQASGYPVVWRMAAVWVLVPGSWLLGPGYHRVWAVQLRLYGCWDAEKKELPRQ